MWSWTIAMSSSDAPLEVLGVEDEARAMNISSSIVRGLDEGEDILLKMAILVDQIRIEIPPLQYMNSGTLSFSFSGYQEADACEQIVKKDMYL